MIEAHLAESMAISYGAEDYCGLYELVWGLNTQFPAEAHEVRLAAAIAAVRKLVSSGLIEIYASDPTSEKLPEALPASDALRVIELAHSWDAPERDSRNIYWFSTTRDGDVALHEGRYRSL